MQTNRTIGPLLAVAILFGCTGDYDKGERQLKLGNYDGARSYYKLVGHEDENYNNAQLKIFEIDSIVEAKLFDRAKNLFFEKKYFDAEALFLKVDPKSRLHADSKYFLIRVDSLRQARRLENERLEKERKIGEEKIAKLKEIEDAKALRQVKQRVRVLFNDLLGFKDKSDFHYYGFGVGYKYNRWLTDVQVLKNTPEANLMLGQGFVVGDLEMLGLEYMRSKGDETEYSRWARKNISDGLKK